MQDREALERAIKDGVVSPDQADKLQGYLARGADPYAPEDPENLKFLSSFNDIFLSLGLVVLLFGVLLVSGLVLGPLLAWGTTPIVVSVSLAVTAWILAEYFSRRRRLALPSMTLATVFYIAAGSAIGFLVAKLGVESARTEVMRAMTDAGEGISLGRMAENRFFSTAYSTQIGSLIAAGLFYLRFRLPYALFLAALSCALAVYSLIADTAGFSSLGWGAVLIVGIVTLGIAMSFDAQDPTRRTRISDNGFWLHVAAAPQIVLGLRGLLSSDQAGGSMLMLVALIGVGLLSLALNRRALIFSALLTFIGVVFSLSEQLGLSGIELVAWPLVIVGLGVVLLGAGWNTARRALLSFVPQDGLLARLFPSEDLLKGEAKT